MISCAQHGRAVVTDWLMAPVTLARTVHHRSVRTHHPDPNDTLAMGTLDRVVFLSRTVLGAGWVNRAPMID
jgi:hypothetical protein